tara:strand:+ start:353 stop:628 length:276 start_codon:yes stop_codon:yes gene_type:complete
MIRKLLLFFSAVLLFIFLKDNGLYTWLDLKQKNSELKNQIARQKNKIQLQNQKIDSLTYNMDYIKQIAENKYGLVKPGERLITIVDTTKQK